MFDPFVWDEQKRAANLRKHGVDFSLAEQFDFASAATMLDNRKDYGERRYRAFGPVAGRMYVIVFTRRGDQVRIISARKANAREIRRYGQNQKKADWYR
jgi:uncharacterized DUF497 family protein